MSELSDLIAELEAEGLVADVERRANGYAVVVLLYRKTDPLRCWKAMRPTLGGSFQEAAIDLLKYLRQRFTGPAPPPQSWRDRPPLL
jgi:hypothetical protein